MWEKYDVASSKPRTGNGGEYTVQAGFGWTNGVILDLLSTYSERLRFPDGQPPIVPVPVQFRKISKKSHTIPITGLLALLIAFVL